MSWNNTVVTDNVNTEQSDMWADLELDFDFAAGEVCVDESLEVPVSGLEFDDPDEADCALESMQGEGGTNKYVLTDSSPGAGKAAAVGIIATVGSFLGFLGGTQLSKRFIAWKFGNEGGASPTGSKSGPKSGGGMGEPPAMEPGKGPKGPKGSLDGIGLKGKAVLAESAYPAGAMDGLPIVESSHQASSEIFTDADIKLMFDSAQSVFESKGKSVVAFEGETASGKIVRYEIPWEVYSDVRARVAANIKVQIHEVDRVAIEVLSAHPELVDGKIDKGQVVVEDEFSFGLEEPKSYLEQSERERGKLVDEAINEMFKDRAARDMADMDMRTKAKQPAKADGVADPFAEPKVKAAPKPKHPVFDREKGLFLEAEPIAEQLSAEVDKAHEAIERAKEAVRVEAWERALTNGGTISRIGERALDLSFMELIEGSKAEKNLKKNAIEKPNAVKGKGGKEAKKVKPRPTPVL